MVYIKDTQGEKVDQLLTSASVIVNNLALTIDEQGNITIKTNGEWKGTISEFTHHMTTLYMDLEKENDEQ